MSLPAYERYRAVQSELLDAVPEHWSVLPCRAVVSERSEKNDGAKIEAYLSLMANVGVIPYEEKGDVGNKKPEDLSKCKIVSPGDLVINSMNYGIGSYGLSPFFGVCSPVYIVLRPIETKVECRFCLRIFENKALQTYAQSFGNGILAHRAAISWDTLKTIPIAVPPLIEQRDILAFLDRETSKIDALVEAQRRLIELLKEKRQAVISHAVTKGLDPAAPMKDSGIQWLGEVPTHWDIVALNRLVDTKRPITYGIVQPGPADPNGRFMVRGQDYSTGWASPENIFRVSAEIEQPYRRARLRSGDIVITIVGAGVGNTAVVPPFLEAANITQTTARIAAEPKQIQAEYLTYFLQSDFGRIQVGMYQKGAAQPGLNLEHLKAFRVSRPPLTEQARIATHLSRSVKLFDPLINEAEAAIALLQERRAALISAAVTGKIDVRGLVPLVMEAA